MIALVLGCCLVCPASVDTLYTVDFSTQPPDWIPGTLWEWQTDCINLYMGVAGSMFYWSEEDSLLSSEIILPSSLDSVAAVFEHWYWTFGGWQAPGEWAQTTMTLTMSCSSVPDPELLWELVFFGPRGYFLESDSGFVALPLTGVAPGDTLEFTFRGLVEVQAQYMLACDTLDWDLYSFSILNFTEEGLKPATWAAIKTVF
jgi:hypothetical protein